MELFEASDWRDEEGLRRWLAEESGCRVALQLTQNRVSMASLKFVSSTHVRCRLHEAFLGAPDAVLLALARYMRSRNAKYWREVRAFAAMIPVEEPETVERELRLRSAGEVYDLQEIADRVNAVHFEGRLEFVIGWGRQRHRSRRRLRSIRYGSCDRLRRIVRIHSWLDDERVPESFVEYIVFHELLHLEIPRVKRGARGEDHPAAFRERERAYPEYARHQETARRLMGVLG